MDALSLLRRHPVLREAEKPAAERLALESEVRHFPAEAQVLTVGLPCEHVLLIAEGAMQLHRKNRSTRTQMLQGLVEAPSLFGDVELYAGFTRWAVSATAVDPMSVVFMPRAVWDAFVGSQPKVAQAMYREACARHMLSIQLVQIFALQKTENKILRLIKELAEGQPPVATLSQIDLARALGLNPKTIARNLAALESEGLIRRDGDAVEVLLKESLVSLEKLGRFGTGTSWKLPRKR